MASLPAFHSFQDSPSYKPYKLGTTPTQPAVSTTKPKTSAASAIQAGPEKDLLVTQALETKIPTTPKEQFFVLFGAYS